MDNKPVITKREIFNPDTEAIKNRTKEPIPNNRLCFKLTKTLEV